MSAFTFLFLSFFTLVTKCVASSGALLSEREKSHTLIWDGAPAITAFSHAQSRKAERDSTIDRLGIGILSALHLLAELPDWLQKTGIVRFLF